VSYSSLDTASRDPALTNRTIACATEQSYENPGLKVTEFAAKVRANPAEGVQLIWPVCLNTEAEYESALAAGNPNPGGDPAVIADGMILSAVQANWPPDPAP
jgi:hypothetical protein